MSIHVTPERHDTWDTLAARYLGNRTLGAEIAGVNGCSPDSAIPTDREIEIPYIGESAAATECESCGASVPAKARYCSSCGTKVGGGKVERSGRGKSDAKAGAGKTAGPGELEG